MEIQASPEMQDARAMAIVTMAIAVQAAEMQAAAVQAAGTPAEVQAAAMQAATVQAAEEQAAEEQATEEQAAEEQAAETQAAEEQAAEEQDWEPDFKETDAAIVAYVKAATDARIALTAMTAAAAAVTPRMEKMKSSFDRAYEKRRQILSRVDSDIVNGYLKFETRGSIDHNADVLARKKAAPGNPAATPKVRPK